MKNRDVVPQGMICFPGSKLIARLVLWIYRIGGLVCSRLFTNVISGAFHSLGRRTTIHLPLNLCGEGAISVGERCHVGPGAWLLCLEQPAGGSGAVIRIGNRCSFAGGLTITAVAGVWIGDDVLVGRNVHISDHAHEIRKSGVPVVQQGITEPKPVWIGDGAWLGQGVVVCPGVRIGRYSVVGANSVVKSDVPDRCLAVGAPAKVVRCLDPN